MNNRLAEALIEKGVSPAQLRAHLNVDRSNVFRWLKNEKQPSDKNKLKIAGFLELSIGEIFFIENDASCATSKNTGTEG